DRYGVELAPVPQRQRRPGCGLAGDPDQHLSRQDVPLTVQLRLDGLGQPVERKCVRHIGPALPEQGGDLAMAVAVTLDQGRQGRRFLEWREVLALEVLDERDLERVVIFPNDGGE